ncbi:adipokinetic hormone/corazonin-related peptide-like [Ischnura elegans]|uniref:adipokinetic hormone/corazonin-related peptide-like n=1 Tax=Ischnura elegans TaxID=197161 RepID=UPI001ED86752|nr:adipokinetic hormone/corazonin-related peptide-like [Ischnura elegans]
MFSWGCLRTACVFVLCVAILQTQCQVTFSRDWKAGKRSQPTEDCPLILSSAVTACQLLVRELRQLDTCDLRSFPSFRDSDLENRNSFADPPGRRR